MENSVKFNEDVLNKTDVITSTQSRAPTFLSRGATLLGRPTLQRTQTRDLLRSHLDQESAEYTKKKQKSKIVNRDAGSLDDDDDDDGDDDVTKHVMTVEEESSGAEYDTDLEVEKREETPNDRYGKRLYNRSCRRMGIRPVGAVVRGLRTQTVEVRGRGMNHQDSLALASAILDNTTVKSLILDENIIGDKGTSFIALMLYENESISNLSLASNNISSLGVRSLLEMMLENTVITKLNLAGNHLTDTDAYMLAEYIEDTNFLKIMVLSHNDFGDEAAMALGPAIGMNESIRSLDLSWNKIRSIGGVSICRGVEANAVMTSLNLAYNGLTNPGAIAMADALRINDILLDLDLTCNRIFDEGAAHISKALTINETLKFLRISNNPMTTMSAITLLNVLKENEYSAMELLDMSSVHIYKNALEVVEEIRSLRPSFKFMYGGVVNSDDTTGGMDSGFSNKNPLTILKDYIASQNLRLVDLFKQFDRDGGGSISRAEFIEGLQSIQVPLTMKQLDRLITMLDKDGDGEVDYGELVQGDKEHRRKMLQVKQQALAELTRKPKKKESEPKMKLLVKRSTQPT